MVSLDLPLLYLLRFGHGWFVMKNLFAAIAVLFAASTGAFALDQDYVKNIKQVEVILEDNATNACWTNLKESREYAEEKLRGLGATLYDNEEKYFEHYYALTINVQSKRLDFGLCFGAISISLKTGTEINDVFHFAVQEHVMSSFTGSQNANTIVIDQIQSFLTPQNSD